MLHADNRIRLPDHSVMILDRMTMAHGLEARSPFLDHSLAEFCARMPVSLKVRGRKLRYAEHRLARRYLPQDVLERPKQGFSVALPYMLRDEYSLLFSCFLHESELVADGILQQAPMLALLAQHAQGRADHGNRLWLLLNAEVWYRHFIRGHSVEQIEARIQQSENGGRTSTSAGSSAP
jgi:asparagine synthase (glutamine-hydrolysing)